MEATEPTGASEEQAQDPGSRPKRATLPSAKPRDTANAATPELRSHHQAKFSMLGQGDSVSSPPDPDAGGSLPPTSLPTSYKRKRTTTDNTVKLFDSDDECVPSRSTKGKRAATSDGPQATVHRDRANVVPVPVATSNDCQAAVDGANTLVLISSLPSQDLQVVGSDGLLKDIPKTQREQRSRDVDQFFDAPYTRASDGRRCRNCKICSKPTHPTTLVTDVSTLRRHLQSVHRAVYLKWAKENSFISMLPKDRKAQKSSEPQTSQQSQLDPPLQPTVSKERAILYSDKQFLDAAIQWLVNTDQPLSALEHPSFRHMINIAARATNGVKIPSRKSTREAIINSFEE